MARSPHGRHTPQLQARVPVETADLARLWAKRSRRPLAAEVTLALQLACQLHGREEALRQGESDLAAEFAGRVATCVAAIIGHPPPASLEAIRQAASMN